MTITAKHSEEKEDKDSDDHYIRRERYSGHYQKSFYVGDNLEKDDIKAKYSDGVLNVSIPKSEKKRKQKGRNIYRSKDDFFCSYCLHILIKYTGCNKIAFIAMKQGTVPGCSLLRSMQWVYVLTTNWVAIKIAKEKYIMRERFIRESLFFL